MKYLSGLLSAMFCCLLYTSAQAQYYMPQNKVWAMSKGVGLDFSNGSPVVIGTAMQHPTVYEEGCASVSAGEGGLLFYSNGMDVWDVTHNLMPHGSAINGTGNNSVSTTQAAVIVPDPANGNRYYLFSLATISGNAKLFCNVVDMTLNNGLGDIDTTYSLRHVLIADSLTEKMVTVAGCQNNVWVVLRSNYQTRYEAYEVTTAGVNINPVMSIAGNTVGNANFVGVLKVNHARNKLIAANANGGGIEMYDFDYNTGLVSNTQVLENANTFGLSFYGATFSPDDSKLYAQQSTSPYNIYQYNLAATNPSASKISLGTGFLLSGDMRLGPDDKIYFSSRYGSNNTAASSKYISRINFPNNLGLACGYQDSVPGLNFLNFPAANIGLRRGLPNIVQVAIPASEQGGTVTDTLICRFPAIYTLQAASGGTAFLWDNGSSQQQRNVTQRGTYWVRYQSGCGILTDTFHLRGEDLPVLSLVLNNNVLSTTNSFNQYQWYKNGQVLNGATNPTLTTNGIGWYSVKVSNSLGCSDSAAYEITATGINSFQTSDQIKVYPNPAQKMIHVSSPVVVRLCLTNIAGQVIAETNEAELDISAVPSGLYLLRISNKDGRLIKVVKVIKQRE